MAATLKCTFVRTGMFFSIKAGDHFLLFPLSSNVLRHFKMLMENQNRKNLFQQAANDPVEHFVASDVYCAKIKQFCSNAPNSDYQETTQSDGRRSDCRQMVKASKRPSCVFYGLVNPTRLGETECVVCWVPPLQTLKVHFPLALNRTRQKLHLFLVLHQFLQTRCFIFDWVFIYLFLLFFCSNFKLFTDLILKGVACF